MGFIRNGRFNLRLMMLLALTCYSQISWSTGVLVIWGADERQPWTAEVKQALYALDSKTQGKVDIFEETLSAARLNTLPDAEPWSRYLNSKYSQADIQLVIAFENLASKQLGLAKESLLPEAEKVSLLGNGELVELSKYAESVSLEEHMKEVTRLIPNLSEHLLISSLPRVKTAFTNLEDIRSNTKLVTDALSYDEMFERVDSLSKGGAISYAVMHKDAKGEHRIPRTVLEELLRRAKVPVFTTYSTLLVPGVVGGHVLDAEKVAQLMVDTMLNPEIIDSETSLGTLKLNATELSRWNIKTNNLPSEVVIYNTPLTFWDNYRAQLYWSLAIIAIALLAISLLTLILKSRTATLRMSEISRDAEQKQRRQIEERLAIERSYHQADRLTQLALESAIIGVFRYDPEADRIWLSPTAAQILDAQTDPAGFIHEVSAFFASRILTSDFEQLQSEYSSDSETRTALTYRLKDRSGEIRWIHSVSEMQQVEDETLRIGVLRDVSEERTLNDRLWRTQQRMTLALDAAGIELFEVEVATGTARVLSQGRGLFELGETFNLVDCLTSLPLPRSTREELVNTIKLEERTFEFTEHTTAGIKHRWHQINTGNIYERDGNRYITVVHRDTSAIRRHQYLAEQRAQENELALSASAAGVARIQPETGNIWMSPRAQEIWDTGPLESDSTSVQKLAKQHHPEDDERVRQAFSKLSRGLDMGSAEYRIRLKSGNYRWIKACGKTHYDLNGKAEIIAVFYDIDEEKQRLNEIEESRDRQTRLFAIIGHELRTPVATLQMMLEEQGAYKLEPFGRQINDTMQHTLSVLDDLRSVTQPQKLQRVESPASAYDQLEQTLGSLNSLLEAKNIRPHFFSNPAAQTLCKLDRQSLRQLVTNLIKNAALHSGASELWLTVEAQLQEADRLNLSISISDNGKGIPNEQIESLFEPFSRGDTTADGTGLGLHICRDLAQRMGGILTFENRTEGGAKFIFNGNFKVVVEPTEAESQPQARTQMLAGLRVLYAEDQKTLQLLTATLLKKQGAQVTLANDGVMALELYQPGAFDFILTDIMMPNLDGYGLTKALRERGFDGKIIGLTAATIGLETDQLLIAGADATLSKPVDIKKLCTLVITEEAH